MTRRRFSILNSLDAEDDDPVLSTINLIDVFMVVIGMLMIAVIDNPVNPFAQDTLTIIRNEGRPDMEIITKDGQKLTRFKASGATGQGNGEKAGTAWRLKDGTMVYVPADATPEPVAAAPGGR
ncbi:DUF2149 domain-containing protein [Variovorax arabinosiphilus]|uniref:DUF2149 domain-containing protein n=1 Tax=Variovorax arabinosiphilus TaxID=3053498 RepID=UPI002578D244|nr:MULTISPECIES: DUF2149 domain-containing protein [unclassified Variovorax]MDM0119199.1 DUF2149 domain-containing protein [Variovorax sp. J2L1-78]MDM0129625.1 DUF2149 domain-containing protein [Variovorax sp. J2L1-63]MDM0232589.1 DUF2149 domain-containing protein [Variovorax sp. J2R1-6]